MGRDEGNELLTTMLRNSKEKKKTLGLKQEPITFEDATTPYSCHGVFTDRSIFNSNLMRIQTPAGT